MNDNEDRLKSSKFKVAIFVYFYFHFKKTKEEKFPFVYVCIFFVNSLKNEKNIEQQNTKKNISMRVWLIYRFFLFSQLSDWENKELFYE